MKKNITISLPYELLKKAKISAVQQDKSLNALIKELLEENVKKQSAYKKARQRQLKLLQKGFNLGTHGNTHLKREELHER